MSDPPESLLRPGPARYLESLLPPPGEPFAEMRRHAAAAGLALPDPQIGRLLAILGRARGIRLALQIGTGVGYGALALARAAPETRLLALEADPRRIAAAAGFLERAGVADRVELRQGEPLELLPSLTGRFDLVYLSAASEDPRRCLDLALPNLELNGLVVVDGMLRGGWLEEVPDDGVGRDQARRRRAFVSYLTLHPQLEALVLPLGDGVGLAVKTARLMTELGGPF